MILEGKIAVITGAARGIGAATAKLFVARGAKVVLTDVLVDQGEALANELGENAVFAVHDVRLQADWARVLAKTRETFGNANILVNNAGIIAFNTPTQDCSEDDYRHVIEVNQLGVFLGMRSVVDHMIAAGGGSIVNTSSAYGLVAGPGCIAYVASKFAVTGMTKAAAIDLGGFGIRVNSIHPGVIDTPINDNAPSAILEGVEAAAKALPVGRIGNAEEMAELIAFLASDAAGFCTGSSFCADGGWTAS